MRALLVALIIALAGCGQAPEEASETPETQAPAPGTGPDVPTWNVSDYWSYQPQQGEPYTYVVTSDAGGDYFLATNAPSLEWFDALDPVSTMGPQRKADLAGSQGGVRVQFFDWPLEDGKTWSADWDGSTYTVTAQDIGDGRFEMTAMQGDIVRVLYRYDPDVRWVTDWVFFDEEGNENFSTSLTDSGTGWTGELVDFTFEVYDQQTYSGPSVDTANLPAPPESTDLLMVYEGGCQESGGFSFAFGPAANAASLATGAQTQGFGQVEQCPFGDQVELVIGEPPYDENWGRSVELGSQDAHLNFTVYARTLTLTPFPA